MSQPDNLEGPPAYMLDASAHLAQLHGEPRADVVKTLKPGLAISSVNWAEVLRKSIARGSSEPRRVWQDWESLGLRILSFTAEDAEVAAQLWSTTRPADLSLGDQACLGLAKRLGLPALTADHNWAALDLEVKTRLIR